MSEKREQENSTSFTKVYIPVERTKEGLAYILEIFNRSSKGIINALAFKRYMQTILKGQQEQIKKDPGLFFKIFFGELIPDYAKRAFKVEVKAIGYFEETDDPLFGIKFSKAPDGWPEGTDVDRKWCIYSYEEGKNVFKLQWSDGCVIIWIEWEKKDVKNFRLFFRLVMLLEAFQILKMGVRVLKKEVRESQIDELTGVLRRGAWKRVLYNNDYLKRGVLLFLDLNNFKQINDKLWHHVGDRVLKMFGEVLVEVFRKNDLVGRWGGDEFIVAFGEKNVNTEGLIERIGNRMSEKIKSSDLDDNIKSVLLERLYTGQISDGKLSNKEKGKYRFFSTWVSNRSEPPSEGTIERLSTDMKEHKSQVKGKK